MVVVVDAVVVMVVGVVGIVVVGVVGVVFHNVVVGVVGVVVGEVGISLQVARCRRVGVVGVSLLLVRCRKTVLVVFFQGCRVVVELVRYMTSRVRDLALLMVN